MGMKQVVNFICCHLLFRVRYHHLENLENTPRCVIAPNHSSIFDPFFIYPKTSNLFIMAKSELFRHRLLGKLLTRYQVFPVNRNKRDPGSLLYAISLFHSSCEEKQLLLFTEGGVVKKEEDIGKRIRNGAVYIAAESQIPLLPVYITRRPRLFSRVDVVFGEAYLIDHNLVKDKPMIREKSKELIEYIYHLKSTLN